MCPNNPNPSHIVSKFTPLTVNFSEFIVKTSNILIFSWQIFATSKIISNFAPLYRRMREVVTLCV